MTASTHTHTSTYKDKKIPDQNCYPFDTYAHTHVQTQIYSIHTQIYARVLAIELLALIEPKTSTHVFIREELVVLRNTVNSFVPASLSDTEALSGGAFGVPSAWSSASMEALGVAIGVFIRADLVSDLNF